MTQEPRISIVIAAKNMENFVWLTLDSVKKQYSDYFECIIVNDGSTDATLNIAKGFEGPQFRIVDGPNRGVSAARNCGLFFARAPIVLFLDADDVLLPGALAAFVTALEANPGVPAAFGGHVKLTEEGVEIAGSARFPMEAGRNTLKHLLYRNVFVNGGTLAMRTGAARAAGGFAEALSFGEDWEFWCRVALLGDFLALPGVSVLGYRQRASGANHQKAGSARHPNFAPVEAIFSNEMIASRFSKAELRRARQAAQANVFWSAARNALAAGEVRAFLSYVAVGLLRYRQGMLNPRLSLRYAASLIRLSLLPGWSRN
jgi:glycosyltransferase involved in cell wall biosynthesis